MKLRRIVENFEKAVSVAKYLRDKIEPILQRVPDGHRPFLVANTLANNQAVLQNLSPEESEVVFNALGDFYDIPGEELSRLTYERLSDEEGEQARQQQIQQGSTAQDMLGDMGVAMGSPDLRQKSTPELKSSPKADGEYEYAAPILPSGVGKGISSDVPPEPLPTRLDMLKAGHSLTDVADQFGESLLNYRQLVTEALYGNIVQPGEALIDRFIDVVDNTYMDFDLHNPKFQKLAEKIFGKMPDAEEWISLLVSSRQSPELKEKLAQIIAASAEGAEASREAITSVAPGVSQPPGFGRIGGGGSPHHTKHWQPTLALGEAAIVTFDRGTVVKADHCVLTVKTHASYRGTRAPYLLMGVGPGKGYKRWTSSSPEDYALHPDFTNLIKRESVGVHDPSKTILQIESRYGKTMSAILTNIARIQSASGRTYDKAQLLHLYNAGSAPATPTTNYSVP